jgi:hypothetical protein
LSHSLPHYPPPLFNATFANYPNFYI